MVISITQYENLKENNLKPYNPRGKTYPNHKNNNCIDNTEKPLKHQGTLKTQPSFEGYSFKALKKAFYQQEVLSTDNVISQIRKHISRKINSGIDFLEDELLKIDTKGLCQKYGVSEKRLDNLKIIKSIPESLKDAFFALPNAVKNWTKKTFGGTTVREGINSKNRMKSLKRRLTGYLLEVRLQETRLDDVFKGKNLEDLGKLLKDGKPGQLKEFLTKNKLDEKVFKKSADELGGLSKVLENSEKFKSAYIANHIQACEDKKLGSFLPNFSTEATALVNRSISGGIAALSSATDFSNLKMGTSGNKDEAQKEWNKRFLQYSSRIAVYAYLGYILNSTFSRFTNKSLKWAFGVVALTSIGSDIMSRVILGVPLHPIKPKKPDTKPYVLHAKSLENQNNLHASALQTYNSFKGKNQNNVAFTGVFDAKMPYNAFKEGYNALKAHGSKDLSARAEQALDIVRALNQGVGKKANIDEIGQAAKDGYLIIGKNGLHRKLEAFIDMVKFPFKLIMGIGRGIANLGLKLAGKEPLKAPKKDGFDQAKFIENIFKAQKENKLGDSSSGLHGTDVMEFSSSTYGTLMKLIGFFTIPWLWIDTHNSAIQDTNNVNYARQKANQRSLQDAARQGFSSWIVKGFNDMFKGLINSSLGGNALGVALNSAGNEALTRIVVGQPLTRKSYEDMKEIEKKRFKKQKWFHKILGGKIKMSDDKVIVGSQGIHSNYLFSNKNPDSFLSYN